MMSEVPEVTSFSTLLRFALALEKQMAALAAQVAAREECRPWRESLLRSAERHTQRSEQLTRLRQERLNEVVLQPVSGIEAATYLPAGQFPDGGPAALAALAAAEDLTATFYTDAARIARSVLGGLERSFSRLAEESRGLSRALRGGPPDQP